MATQQHFFDIVSRVDLQELDNAMNQARKEIDTRFDFRGTGSRIEGGRDSLIVFSSDEFHLGAMRDVIEARLVKREVPLEALNWGPIADGPKGTVKREAKILQGIDSDKAREITKFVKKLDKKISIAVQQEQIRISSKSKDALQEVLKAVRESDFAIPLQFTNYR